MHKKRLPLRLNDESGSFFTFRIFIFFCSNLFEGYVKNSKIDLSGYLIISLANRAAGSLFFVLIVFTPLVLFSAPNYYKSGLS